MSHHHRRNSSMMMKFTAGLVSGVAIGMMIGTGMALTDSGYRHRLARDGRRAMHKAGNFIEDAFDNHH